MGRVRSMGKHKVINKAFITRFVDVYKLTVKIAELWLTLLVDMEYNKHFPTRQLHSKN